MTSPSTPDVAAPPLPSDGVRTLVTFLIFIHFFFLLVSIKSKTVSSGLEQDLRERAPGLTPYVQLLGMDLSYMFHLTYYDPSLADPTDFRPADTDFYVEADIPQPDGSIKQVRWPTTDVWPGTRYHRFERLVHTAAIEAETGNDAPASTIAQGISRRLMAENQCRNLTLHFHRRMLQNLMLPPGPQLTAERARDPNSPANFPAVYEVNAYLTDDNTVGVAAKKDAYNAAAPRLPGAAPAGTAPAGTAPVPTSTPSPTPSTTTPAATPTSTRPAVDLNLPSVFPSSTGGPKQ